MIITSINNHGQECEYVSIDLSNDEYPNRVLDIYEALNDSTNTYEYTICPHWPIGHSHPDMKMDEKDFLDFVEAVNKIARKIIDR